MQTKLKYILISLAVIGLAIGLYFFVNFQLQMRNAIIATQYGQADVIKFLQQQFPDQVKAYVASQKALSANVPIQK